MVVVVVIFVVVVVVHVVVVDPRNLPLNCVSKLVPLQLSMPNICARDKGEVYNGGKVTFQDNYILHFLITTSLQDGN